MSTIAFSTYSFGPKCTALEGMQFALEHRFQGIEFGSWTHWPEFMSPEDVKYIRTQGSSNNMELSIHFIHRGVDIATHVRERREKYLSQLQHTLQLAGDLGAKVVVVHPGSVDYPGVPSTKTPETMRMEAIENLRTFLEKVLPLAENVGVAVCLENLFHSAGNVFHNYAELFKVVETIGHPLMKIILDIGHADRTDGLNEAFKTFGKEIRHIHIHDSSGLIDHLEIGKGKLDFYQYLDILKSFPYTLAIESRDETDPEGCVLRSRNALMKVLGKSGD